MKNQIQTEEENLNQNPNDDPLCSIQINGVEQFKILASEVPTITEARLALQDRLGADRVVIKTIQVPLSKNSNINVIFNFVTNKAVGLSQLNTKNSYVEGNKHPKLQNAVELRNLSLTDHANNIQFNINPTIESDYDWFEDANTNLKNRAKNYICKLKKKDRYHIVLWSFVKQKTWNVYQMGKSAIGHLTQSTASSLSSLKTRTYRVLSYLHLWKD